MRLSLQTEPGPLSVGLMPSPQVGEVELTGVERYEQAAAPWDLLVKPIGSRAFRYRKRYLATPSFVLYEEGFTAPFRVQGLTPAGMIGLSVPIVIGDRTSYWGKPLHETGVPASIPGALDAVIDAGQTHLIVLLTSELVRRSLGPEQAALLEATAATRVLPAGACRMERLRGWLLGTLDQAHRWPAMLHHPPALWVLEQDLVSRILAAVELLSTETSRPALPLRRLALDRALGYLRESDMLALTMAELSAAARASQRTLQYAFRDTYGIGPLAFLRRWRLHAARRALAATSADTATVAEVAYGLGFWHLSRFAAEYRRIFGESPSTTLRGRIKGEARNQPRN